MSHFQSRVSFVQSRYQIESDRARKGKAERLSHDKKSAEIHYVSPYVVSTVAAEAPRKACCGSGAPMIAGMGLP